MNWVLSWPSCGCCSGYCDTAEMRASSVHLGTSTETGLVVSSFGANTLLQLSKATMKRTHPPRWWDLSSFIRP
jgi:hypothetical protein